MKEIWKKITGYSDYMVSSIGRVKSLKTKNTKILKLKIDKDNSRCVNLTKNKKQKMFYVHRLVAQEFIGVSNLTVNHIDGDRANNNINNLEYMALKDNYKHFKENFIHKIKGENNSQSKLKNKQVKNIRKFYNLGIATVIELSIICSISKSQIYRILNFENWK